MDKFANIVLLDVLEEKGDAEAAWEAVKLCTHEGLPLPAWVSRYLGETAAGLLEHFANRDVRNPMDLPKVLGFDRVKKEKWDWTGTHLDPHEAAHAIDEIIRSGEVKSVASAAKQYSETVLKGRFAPETVRSWYYSVRRERPR
ncbi:hypothetical protein [Sandarakinorhabdus sp.]|uniref:hypothetical protein n=1 Tax=Sandarakinorhabdus sp. TaxID=1916663 RepID=UPI003F71D075